MTAPNDPKPKLQVLESGRRLSQSLLWQILSDYYRTQALDAWRDGAIPYHITSNPNITHAYARVMLAYQQDLAVAGQTPQAPLPIVEVGAGSGAFAFQFLKQFERLRQSALSPTAPIVYVMTDFSAATVAAWENHPQLTPFVEAGLLDFACFDPLTESSLTLRHSGRLLSPANPTPLVAIANYFFDSLPQDLFGIHGGQLYEIAVSILAPEDKRSEDKWPSLTDLDFEYVYRPIESVYYEDEAFERVLRSYVGWDGEVVRFPIGALMCCRTLRMLGGSDLLLLAADRGAIHEDELRSETVDALFNIHDGAFSMPVNFHAIETYLCRDGGQAFRPPVLHRSLCIVGFLARTPRPTTQAAFDEYVSRFGPDDASTLIYWITQQVQIPVRVLIALLRLSHHDPWVCVVMLKQFQVDKDRLDGVEIDRLASEVEQVWANYYHQGDRYNLPFELGAFFMRLERPAVAARFFIEAERYYGETQETVYNLAACYHQLGLSAQALACLDRAHTLPTVGPVLVQRHHQRRLAALRSVIVGPVS